MDDWDPFGREMRFRSMVDWAELLSELFFLSDNEYMPDDGEDYRLGTLDPEDWWPLANQLSDEVDLEVIIDLAEELDMLLEMDGLPTELLEAPLDFLASILAGHLPRQPSSRRVGSRKLVQIAQKVVYAAQELSDVAQALARSWADLHRAQLHPIDWEMAQATQELLEEASLEEDLPVPVTGFSLLLGLTLMRWPDRAGELPLPPMFDDPDAYAEMLTRWTSLPDDPGVMEEGAGEAEALFAQAQLAYILAQLGEPDDWDVEEREDWEEDVGEEEGEDSAEDKLAYSRLSRAIMWVHHKCRHCSERDEVACKVVTIRPVQPVPLLDVASEVANSGRLLGCVQM